MSIHPVILCGGSGTRLWPLSRQSYPKQFVPIVGAQTLFQTSTKRLMGESYEPPVILTGPDFRFIVTQQLSEIGVDPGAIIIEPEGRNTAPAILAAALHLSQIDPEAVMLVAPSDHLIPNEGAFRDAVQGGLDAVREGRLVTFGVVPTEPHVGYGYLELADRADSGARWSPLKSFVEKPSPTTANMMLDAGTYFWNAGIFLFRAKDIIAAFEMHSPDYIEAVGEAVKHAKPDLGFLRLDPASWADVPNISIDYAIMEKAENLAVVPFASGWSDLGDWDAVWAEGQPDSAGLVLHGGATAIDCANSMLRSDSETMEIVGIGLDNILAVAMDDAVLIADKSRTQDVKEAVLCLKARNIPQATHFPKDHRPWGWFERLATGGRFQVKRIHVHPGAALSLQSHVHRSEHWIVVEGTAKVTLNDTVQLVTENQSVYIPLGAKHRLENPGKFSMVLIEVQTGSYVGEDDITRYEDIYARTSHTND